jgi:hypothetical protein
MKENEIGLERMEGDRRDLMISVIRYAEREARDAITRGII